MRLHQIRADGVTSSTRIHHPAGTEIRIERNRIEVERLREIRMTTGKFHRAARDAGFTMADEKLYFIRPVFKMKFGLPPISANIIKPLPGLRDILALEAGYILKNG